MHYLRVCYPTRHGCNTRAQKCPFKDYITSERRMDNEEMMSCNNSETFIDSCSLWDVINFFMNVNYKLDMECPWCV
jgi:hypothetical protein